MIKVKATAEYEKRNLKDKELGYIPKAGEEFEISQERFNVLNGNNFCKAIFVEEIKEEQKADVKKPRAKRTKKGE